MSIIYDAKAKTLTLHTRRTTYQMMIGSVGHLLHLYYGRRIENGSMAYRLVRTNYAFSPNSYEMRFERDVSLDTLPQEYSSSNTGDFRVPALECVGANGAVGADLRYKGHEIRAGKYALHGLPASFSETDEAETLCVTLADAATGLTVELLYGVFEQSDVITRAAMIRNDGCDDVTLERAASLCLDIPFGQWELLHFHGRHCMERTPQRMPLMRGIQTVSSRRGASSHHHNPFVVLMESGATETRGECLGVMPVYSGNHRTDLETDQTGSTRVVSGISPDMFSWRLAPGKTFETPEAILCWTDEGLGALSGAYHDFIRRNLIRSPWKDRRRPVLINSWEAMMFDVAADDLLAFARSAAELGVEMLVLDDGWFGKRDNDDAGLGDWTPNPDKLPGGLKPLADAVHALGLKFGLWIEPEMVNEDSDLYRAHPDWALTVLGRKPSVGRGQLVLDMGRADVVDYLYDVFSTLLRENPIDYIKWDMNRNMTDVFSGALPPLRQKEASHRYILGVYALMDRLTRAFPEVLFEGCAGGGGRFDAGILHYMPQIWCSDDTDAIERLSIQMGTSVGYPVSAMGAHVSVCPNQQTGRTVPFGTRGIVAMSGTFGYELDPRRLTAEEKAQVRAQIDRFHRWYDLIQSGRLHRLNEQPMQGDFVAWEYAAPDGGQALVNLVMTHPRPNTRGPHIRLRGLVPDAMYRLEEAHFEGVENAPDSAFYEASGERDLLFSGASLMYAGYTLPTLLGDYPGAQLLFARVDASEGD